MRYHDLVNKLKQQLPRVSVKWAIAAAFVVVLFAPFLVDSSAVFVASTALAPILGLALILALTLPRPQTMTDEYGLIVGGGTFPDNVLFNVKPVDAPSGAKQVGGKPRQILTPAWDSPELDQALPRSAAAFVVYPVIEGAVGEAKTPTFGRGGLGIPHTAAQTKMSEARKFMKLRQRDIAEAMANWKLLDKEPLAMFHLVATGMTNTAFFAESKVIDHVPLSRTEHIVYIVDGMLSNKPDAETDRNPPIADGLAQIEDRLKRRPGIIISDNFALGINSWEEHLRILLMLTGATRIPIGERVHGDIFRVSRPGCVWIPFVPRSIRLPRSSRGFNQFQIQQMTDLQGWRPMWSRTKMPVDWKGRSNMILLMAGPPGPCAAFAEKLTQAFQDQNIAITPETVIAPVQHSSVIWVCPLIQAVNEEVADSYLGKTLSPYCVPKPALTIP